MLIPIQCFSCGKEIGHLYKKYIERCSMMSEAEKKKPQIDILEKELGLKRYCCKRMILGHVDLLDKI